MSVGTDVATSARGKAARALLDQVVSTHLRKAVESNAIEGFVLIAFVATDTPGAKGAALLPLTRSSETSHELAHFFAWFSGALRSGDFHVLDESIGGRCLTGGN